MADFVGDNPVVASGCVIAHGDERIVVGDSAGGSLTLRWTEAAEVRTHGSPSAAIVELPRRRDGQSSGAFTLQSEGKYVQVRYLVEPLDGGLTRLSYTIIEDMGALLAESEAPGLIHHAPGETTRMSVGPD